MSDQIRGFSGDYRFLSNFWNSPVRMFGMTFQTAEHAYQAIKMGSVEDVRAIRNAKSPSEAKRLGRVLQPRSDWDFVRLYAMKLVVGAKFEQNQGLRAMLLATGDRPIVEENTWHDNFFGECSCEKCKNITKHNHLGRILEKVRSELISDALRAKN